MMYFCGSYFVEHALNAATIQGVATIQRNTVYTRGVSAEAQEQHYWTFCCCIPSSWAGDVLSELGRVSGTSTFQGTTPKCIPNMKTFVPAFTAA